MSKETDPHTRLLNDLCTLYTDRMSETVDECSDAEEMFLYSTSVLIADYTNE